MKKKFHDKIYKKKSISRENWTENGDRKIAK